MKIGIALVTFACLQLSFAKDNYFFSDQANWEAADSSCGGEEQSPINIITEDVLHDSSLDQPFTFSANFLDPIEKVKCKNTGQSYTCFVEAPSEDRTMQGGNLIKAPFKLVQFHVHFGSASSHKGSEHRVNSYQYPAEIHFVFMHSKLASLDDLSSYGDLAVWGFFIEIVPNTYEKQGSFADILKEIATLTNYDDSTELNGTINLSEMIPVNNYHSMGSFYRYKGGLTTPGCNEWVQWTVFKDPLYISKAQYDMMVGGKTWPNANGDVVNMVNTFRKPQLLNGRPVTRSLFAGDGGSTGSFGSGGDGELSSKVVLQSSALCLLVAAVGKLLL